MQDHQFHSLPPSEISAGEVSKESRGKVLIVEDELDILELLTYHLGKERYSTFIAEDGITACQLVDAVCPDLILLDIMLPGKDGWQVCQYIRAHADNTTASAPVIMLTAFGEQENKLKGIELGADVYLSKPYSMKEVLLHCNRLIEDRKQKLSLEKKLAQMHSSEQDHLDLQSMLSHEIYNQLAVIGGFCKRLKQNIVAGETEKNKLYLDSIEKSACHLLSVSEEILLIRKIETGEVDLPVDIFDFSDVVEDVVSLYRQKAESKLIVLQTSIAKFGRICTNRVAIRLIISNLLENAVKYCNAGSKVRFQADVDFPDRRVWISVSDDGPGIPHNDQEHIFERFYRGRDIRARTQGNGVGLFAVRKLAEAMGGEATVVSSKGNGSSFLVRFSIQP